MGSYLTIINNTPGTYYIKVGPDQVALEYAGFLVTISDKVTSFLISTALKDWKSQVFAASCNKSISLGYETSKYIFHDNMVMEGYVRLKPGEKWKSPKLSLSLWQQCECIRTRLDGNNHLKEAIYMRPIFTGATDESNNDHYIQWWVNTYGHTKVSRNNIKDTFKDYFTDNKME